MHLKYLALGAFATLMATSAFAANRPAGYKTICSEGKTCSVATSTNVAFGRADRFFYKQLSGTFLCAESTFGGRTAGGVNECSVPTGTSSSSSPTSSSSSSRASSSSISSSIGSSSSSTSSNGNITGATCVSTGSVTVSETIIVAAGETYDGGCKTFNATSALGDGSQKEGQKPVFRINGGTLKNVILGSNGADGVHFYGGGRLENFRWTDVGEDAFTVKESGTVTITGITGSQATDKFGQINAASTVNISNAIIDNVGKVIRQNGGTSFKVTVTIDRARLSNTGEGVFRSDSSTSVAKLTNSFLRNTGDLCIGSWASCTGENNQPF